MPCEHYKNALIDAAVTGRDLTGAAALTAELRDLRAHLAECVACRAALAEEQSLLAAMDSGLRVAANAEVPPSLLPRVRASLDEAATARPRWSSQWLALAVASTAVAMLFLPVKFRRNNADAPSINSVSNLPTVPEVTPTTQTPSLSNPGGRGKLPQKPLASTARNAPLRDESASRRRSPEILVSRDQEALLASYAKQWSSRVRAPLVSSELVEAKLEPLRVPPIQIANLDVKPLAEEGSQ